AGAHSLVLLGDGGVLDRHVPAAELNHPGRLGDVPVIQGSSQRHAHLLGGMRRATTTGDVRSLKVWDGVCKGREGCSLYPVCSSGFGGSAATGHRRSTLSRSLSMANGLRIYSSTPSISAYARWRLPSLAVIMMTLGAASARCFNFSKTRKPLFLGIIM